MASVTILGRGDDWVENYYQASETWGTLTCLLKEGLRDKPFNKLFAFDGINLPEIKRSLDIAHERHIPVISTLDYGDQLYPIRDICREYKTSYFMNSISYMLAYAIYLKFNKMYINGIGGRKRWDYEQGRPFIIFWLGVATGRRVEYEIGRGSARWLFNGTTESNPKNLNDAEMSGWHK